MLDRKGGSMSTKVLLYVVLSVFIFSLPVFSQVATRTGSIYGKIVDDKGAPLPGVTVTLESSVIPTQTANSGETGGFRFANLAPGVYSVNFAMEGFSQVSQEEVRVSTGSEVQLQIKLKPSLSEEFTVIGETPVVDTKKTGTSDTFNREYLDDVPSARDPWTIIDQTAGIDTDRYNVAGSESGQQSAFVARGGDSANTVWNYDGVNAGDPTALGGSPTYFDFDAFEELQISTGGNDASVGTSGVVVNIVTKRGGNKWEGNASYFYSGDSLQGDNTPDELAAIGAKSNRLDEVKDYGFDLGGPLVKDKIFVWGAYRKNEIGLITVANTTDFTELEDFNFKANFNWDSSNESQFGYFKGEKNKTGRAAYSTSIQAPETLWNQGGTETILPGIWTGQHTWIPNDHTIITGRYGYIGTGLTLSAVGGADVPIVYLRAIPRYEDTLYSFAPIDRPAHDINVDTNYFKEKVLGGDHEFKFGFEYKTATTNSVTTYGNGIWLTDYNQTAPRGALTSGYFLALHNLDGKVKQNRTSVYATDTFRKDRLTMNLGFRLDHLTGTNEPSTIPGAPGFEDLVGPVEFTGNEGPTFTDFSPRVGATYDLSGNGKTILRGNFAKYSDGYNEGRYLRHTNPTFFGSGAQFFYTNLNGDREITRDEITSGPFYFGGLTSPIFDIQGYLSKKLVADDLKNSGSYEMMAGFEHQLATDLSVAVTYTHRNYHDPIVIVPFGLSQDDYIQIGTFTANSVLGNFDVPIYSATLYDDQGVSILTNINDYKTSYDGVDLTMRKRMSNNLQLSGSLTLQRQRANYDGGDSTGFYINDGGLSGSVFPFDPGNLPFLNDKAYGFPQVGSGKSGVYPYSEWNVKFSGVYQFPWDISVGAFGRYQQGYPYVLFATFGDSTIQSSFNTSTHRILVEPFGNRRYENIFTLDLQFEKGIDFGSYGKVALTANLFNVTNTNTVIRRNRSVTSTTLNAIDELISPRAIRFGARYSF
jgi:hypothetical protein